MSNKNKRKGKDYETYIANIIDKYCNKFIPINNKDIKDELKVKRSPFSGIAKDEKGDIDLGYYKIYLKDLVIECKKWNRLNFNNNIFPVLNTVYRLWTDYKKQNEYSDLILVFAANYGKSYVATNLVFNNINSFAYKNIFIYEFEPFIATYIKESIKNNIKTEQKNKKKK